MIVAKKETGFKYSSERPARNGEHPGGDPSLAMWASALGRGQEVTAWMADEGVSVEAATSATLRAWWWELTPDLEGPWSQGENLVPQEHGSPQGDQEEPYPE